MDIKGQLGIVCGAASGLGRATALRLAGEGARVVLVDWNADALAEVADETGGAVFPSDVADGAAAEEAIDRITAGLGVPRVLVNCAGIATGARIVGKDGPGSLSDFEHVIRVNLIGTFNWMRVVATAMQKGEPNADGERGVIINTASVAAFEGQIGQAAYSASKGGVAALTLPAARELARYGIRVCTIAPGLFETPMLMGLPEDVQKSLAANMPFPSRFGRPAEYAQLVVSIIENPMLNGETIRLDAAVRLQPR